MLIEATRSCAVVPVGKANVAGHARARPHPSGRQPLSAPALRARRRAASTQRRLADKRLVQ